jgi:hypothetical protein
MRLQAKVSYESVLRSSKITQTWLRANDNLAAIGKNECAICAITQPNNDVLVRGCGVAGNVWPHIEPIDRNTAWACKDGTLSMRNM